MREFGNSGVGGGRVVRVTKKGHNVGNVCRMERGVLNTVRV
jgi:hypothetical protein